MNESAALPELLRRRLDIVGRLSQATSEMQKWQQARMSVDMDAQRCEMAGDAPETARDLQHRLQHELHEAQCRADEAESGMARCEALIAEIEQSLAETDLEIQTWSRDAGG
jgi:chromosome segregation ATPase